MLKKKKNLENVQQPFCILLRNCSSDKIDLPYVFYCDNLFTTLPLAHESVQRDYNGVGTIRQNRMGKKCPLKDVKIVSKENRGAYDGVKAKFKGIEFSVTRWKDNEVLTLASSLYGVEPLGTKKDGAKQKESTFTLTLLLLCANTAKTWV